MRIYLYLGTKILTFEIPASISGSFSFDPNSEEEYKLINIEARDNNWVLYSNSDSSVFENGNPVDSIVLKANSYHVIQKNNTNYLIYVTNLFDDSFTTYTYNDSINLTIGNDATCNINFANSIIKGMAAKIYKYENHFVLDIASTPVYINKELVTRSNFPIKNGDTIDIYGLKLIFFNNLLLINNPLGIVKTNLTNTSLAPYQAPAMDPPQEIQTKDIDLYSKEDNFSKSPRIRRLIKTKAIELSPPPRQEGERELPLLLTIGPMATMAILAGVRLASVISKIAAGEATFKSQITAIVQASTMLLSMLLWPTVTRMFNKKLKEKRKKELLEKYNIYLMEKRKELTDEYKLQKDILIENLIPVEQCVKIIEAGNINFWDKRTEQNDFLEVRLGLGDQKLAVEVGFPKEGFTIEEDALRKQAEALVNEFKYLKHVPIGYSFYKHKITAIMGEKDTTYGMINNIVLQLITFYSYEDIKIVVFTNKENEKNWDYIKYLNHSFSNDKSIRFFSSDTENAKDLGDYLNMELNSRMNMKKEGNEHKPYYIVICDDYDMIKRQAFRKTLTEEDDNLGFSLIIMEKEMSNLPSKCNNFIYMGRQTSDVLTDSFEGQDKVSFNNEINNSIDMMKIAKRLANIPIEFEDGYKELPEAINFLEMEKVGKVEQLNIMNRWRLNDSTKSLKAEVGVDENGNLMYLDLHEKYHGPHGLIAGMTGSGKSEFIITYILSMAINYSPEYVSFILIDYKGGGLAGAFENKATGISLPHLAGTITNLDKAEMDRTLVSIDSEIKRRQQLFNEARDALGESTIDIYKYQKYYKEGRLTKPVPHLFIICDEFAELKAQQPDFMDNLISVARIGRSLGVHLILATQKPSGVVNDQIWSNTKFRVCLKVQDASDSKEMLKRPEAANIKQTGRFYLQVGYDEYFALGQSGWCGAKYYPSEKIVKQVDKSVNFIDDSGDFIKSIQAGNSVNIEAQGEQLSAIMKEIINVAKMSKVKADRLWLDDIPETILVDNLEKDYQYEKEENSVTAIIGEYDAPEKQEQGLLIYEPKVQGNTAVFGNDPIEKEKILNTIIYSICKNYTSDEVNIYAIDYGSETLSMFNSFPQIGGIVFIGEDEKFKNLFKLITEEIKERKKLLLKYGGSFDAYNQSNEKKLPQIILVMNNYEGILDNYNTIYENIASIGRDCERYGVYLIITANTMSSLGRRVSLCLENKYAFHLNDASDYYGVFGGNTKIRPRERLGRGLTLNDGVHEFQTASIVADEKDINSFIAEVSERIKANNPNHAKEIPSLPKVVTTDIVKKDIKELKNVPIGISKNDLEVVKYDFMQYPATIITSNRLGNMNNFMEALVDIMLKIPDNSVYFLDIRQELDLSSKEGINYVNNNFAKAIDNLISNISSKKNKDSKLVYIFYGLERIKAEVDSKKLEELFTLVKASDNTKLILADSTKNLKSIDLDIWYSKVKNNTDGIWVGKGITEQQTFRISRITKEMQNSYSNSYGYVLIESEPVLVKLVEAGNIIRGDDADEE